MTRNDIDFQKLPDAPGIYFFHGRDGKILYIGKATSIRDRVKSYFNPDLMAMRGPKLVAMLEQAVSVEGMETGSVLEALIQEATLIKKHHPPYNTRDKDDKSFNFVVITDEDYPRVLVMRGRNMMKSVGATRRGRPVSGRPHRAAPTGGSSALSEISAFRATYGPFPAGGALRDALAIIRRIFPFRDTCMPESGKPCFNAQIGLCPGVCAGWISSKDYAKQIRRLRLFFEGKRTSLIKELEREMWRASKALEFEKAAALKKTIFGLQHIQDVALIKADPPFEKGGQGGFRGSGEKIPLNPPFSKGETLRIEAYDVAHIQGTGIVGAMVVIENGEAKTSEYKRFKLRTVKGADDTASLAEILRRRLKHTEWRYPHLIAVDGGVAQKNVALRVLREFDLEIPVVGVVKDARHRPREIIGTKSLCEQYEKPILLGNHEAHRFAIAYHRKVRGKIV